MKNILILLLFLITSLTFSQFIGKERIEKLNKSVVRVIVGSESFGTGFFIHKDGWIATCEHVVKPAYLRDSITKGIIGLKDVFVEFQNGEKVEVEIMKYLLKDGYENSLAYDYSILKVKTVPKTKYQALKIGSWSDVNEGDILYSCGYPLGIKQRFISQGLLSTKWTDSTTLYSNKVVWKKKYKKVAWLDLTMNPGNSGGPIIKIGETPEDDKVIGIATFILNPFAKAAKDYSDHLKTSRVDIEIGGISNNKVNKLFANSISNNSIGVSGCISIDYLSSILNLVNLE